MGMILGSAAIKHHCPDFREPNGIDIYQSSWSKFPLIDPEILAEIQPYRPMCQKATIGTETYFLHSSLVSSWQSVRGRWYCDDVADANSAWKKTPFGNHIVQPLLECIAAKRILLARGDTKHQADLDWLLEHGHVADLPEEHRYWRSPMVWHENNWKVWKGITSWRIANPRLRFVEERVLRSILRSALNCNDLVNMYEGVELLDLASEEQFLSLSFRDKIQLIAREALALLIERSMFPLLHLQHSYINDCYLAEPALQVIQNICRAGLHRPIEHIPLYVSEYARVHLDAIWDWKTELIDKNLKPLLRDATNYYTGKDLPLIDLFRDVFNLTILPLSGEAPPGIIK